MSREGDRTSRQTLRAYVRALEAALQRTLERPLVLSHRDWDLARRWHDDGIPLGLVVEILEERGAKASRGLGSIASRVAEAWRVVESGRRDEPPEAARGVAPSVSAATLRAAADRTEDRALHLALLALADAVPEEGRPVPAAIERGVDEAIERHAPRAWWTEALESAREDLGAYRGRMPPDRFERTVRRAAARRVRQRLGLTPRAR